MVTHDHTAIAFWASFFFSMHLHLGLELGVWRRAIFGESVLREVAAI